MKTLGDAILKLSFDGNGLISSLKGSDGRERVSSPGLWRIVYRRGEELEIELKADNVPLKSFDCAGDSARIVHESELLRVELSVAVQDGRALFDAKLSCKGGIVISEFQFPAFNLGKLDSSSLLWSRCGGELMKSVPDAIARHHSAYMAQDDKAVQMSCLYPGEAATNCFSILDADGAGGLYFGSHGKSFSNTLHLLRGCPDGVRASLVKYPFIGEGSSASYEGFVLAPFKGSWHEAAKIYRSWASSWFKAAQPPQWVRSFNGWQRLIMRHQYGQSFFSYATLDAAHADGAAAGIDSILLFGWTRAGHDCKYPEYLADESQNGLVGLKDGIAEVHKAGGKVILYFNGQLIDKDTDYYRREGHRISVKDLSGLEHTETYSFGGEGTALRLFGNRVFATACFSCREWLELLKSCADIAIEAGADGVFYDQFGYKLWPCCDPSHGHPVPDMGSFETKAKVVAELGAYVQSRKPGMAFGTEWLSDRIAPHVDFIHNVVGGFGGSSFVEWFRYAFPEVLFTDREIRDDKGDFVRRVNNALLLGLKSDVEIYRCRATIASAPKYGEYLAKANALRQEFKSFLFEGEFLDVGPFKLSNPEFKAKAFAKDGELLLLLTHFGKGTERCEVSAPGFELELARGLGGFSAEGCKLVKLSADGDALAVMKFRRTAS